MFSGWGGRVIVKSSFKTILVCIVLVLSMGLFAAESTISNEFVVNAQARVDAIAAQLQNMGIDIDARVDLNSISNPLEQEAVLNAKYEELQKQLESLQTQNAE